MTQNPRVKEINDAFSKALKEICPDFQEPDKETNNGQLGKAPDFYLPSEKIAIEMKSISLDLLNGNSVGRSVIVAKKKPPDFGGTIWVNFSEEEFLRLSEKMTGKLRKRVSDAEKQLRAYYEKDEVLSVCCVFAEIAETDLLEWEKRILPTRSMVRASADAEFRRRNIDVMVIFTLDERSRFCLDVFQAVYKDEHLQPEFKYLMAILAEISKLLPLKPDLSVIPDRFFVEANPRP